MDDVIAAEMKDHHILGASMAIIENGEISKAQGYGFTDKSRGISVTTSTLFQAGSVSKPVAALGALRLFEDGRLSLDEDVNRWLKQRKLQKTSLRRTKRSRCGASSSIARG